MMFHWGDRPYRTLANVKRNVYDELVGRLVSIGTQITNDAGESWDVQIDVRIYKTPEWKKPDPGVEDLI